MLDTHRPVTRAKKVRRGRGTLHVVTLLSSAATSAPLGAHGDGWNE